MGMFSVRGGPHEGVTPVEWREVVATAEQAGARRLTHDPDDNVYGFLIDAPTTPHAFAVVREVVRPIYGDNWWAEVSTFPHFN
jgi:hypothetical protein